MRVKAVVVGPFATNCYIIAPSEGKEAVVVDPGAEAERILSEVKAMGLEVGLILSTHGHGDHTGAVAWLKEATGAPYALHSKDIPLLSQAGVARAMTPDFRDPPEPDRLLKGGDTVPVGEEGLLVLETPGHTPGGVCLYGGGAVFTGDTLFQGSVGRTDFPGGSHGVLISSILSKLMVLPEETVVCPGHGPQTTIGDERRWNPFLGGRRRPYRFR